MKTGVIHARCAHNGKPFEMAIQERPGGGWNVTRAYPLGITTKVYPEDEVTYQGTLYIASDYNGCPHCQDGKSFVRCNTCGKFSCYDGSGHGHCSWCGLNLTISGTVKDFKTSKGQ